jgi:hypothetical protein
VQSIHSLLRISKAMRAAVALALRVLGTIMLLLGLHTCICAHVPRGSASTSSSSLD